MVIPTIMALFLLGAQNAQQSPCPTGTEVKTRKERLGKEAVTRYLCKDAKGQTIGPFVVVYRNNRYAQTGNYDSRGKLHGAFVYFDKEGNKLAETEFVHGAETGERRAYFPKGQLQSSGGVVDGQPEGEWVFLHANGRKASEGMMKQGQAHGAWTYWDEEGLVLRNGVYEQGQPSGHWAERASAKATFARITYDRGQRKTSERAEAMAQALACKQVSEGWWLLDVPDLGRVVAGWPDGLGQARITPAMRQQKVIGFRVESVQSGGLVSSCGFKEGDVIRSVNDVQTLFVGSFAQAAQRVRASGTAVFHVERDHRIVLIRIEKRSF